MLSNIKNQSVRFVSLTEIDRSLQHEMVARVPVYTKRVVPAPRRMEMSRAERAGRAPAKS